MENENDLKWRRGADDAESEELEAESEGLEDEAAAEDSELDDIGEDESEAWSEAAAEDEGDDDGEDDTEDDSEDEDVSEDEDDTEDEDAAEEEGETEIEAKAKDKILLIYPEYTKRLPFSLLAALIGAVVGIVPVVLCAYWFGTLFYPFYIAAPLLIYIPNTLFKGCRDIRALICNAVFSLASTYVGILSCRVALIMLYFEVPISRFPSFLIEAFGLPEILPETASAYVYPLLFTALGIAIIWELTRFALKDDAAQKTISAVSEA